jgi:hypothetical protein
MHRMSSLFPLLHGEFSTHPIAPNAPIQITPIPSLSLQPSYFCPLILYYTVIIQSAFVCSKQRVKVLSASLQNCQNGRSAAKMLLEIYAQKMRENTPEKLLFLKKLKQAN